MLLPAHPGVSQLSVSADDGGVDSLHYWSGLRGLATWQETSLAQLFERMTAYDARRPLLPLPTRLARCSHRVPTLL
ncbi:hypothetical protein AB0Q95_12960 [Streptomyces sp. NPDC059900]|uniref:hypothetical protein n=1 Tax=Streptomyces sp. NPDC059900 TaxID=3155816 RepID=UPI00343B1606